MEFLIEEATKNDVRALADIIGDIEEYFGGTDIPPVETRVKDVQSAVFEQHPMARVLVARSGESVAGMAAYSFLWPAVGATWSLYLKELYVVDRFRRQGVAAGLLHRLFEVAAQERCTRVEWTSEVDNRIAADAYAALGFGANINPSKVFYRVEDHEFPKVIKQLSHAGVNEDARQGTD